MPVGRSAGGADGDKGAGHSDPHRNSNDSKAHAGGLTLSKTIEFPRAKRVHKCGEHLLPQGNPACNRVVVCPIPDTRFSEIFETKPPRGGVARIEAAKEPIGIVAD
jgi:hypothetical protein